MTSSRFRPPSPPDAPVSGDFVLQEGEGGEHDEDKTEAATTEEADTFEPLVLWEAGPGEEDHRISVDPRLCKWLRPHQREGVQFMFECGEFGGGGRRSVGGGRGGWGERGRGGSGGFRVGEAGGVGEEKGEAGEGRSVVFCDRREAMQFTLAYGESSRMEKRWGWGAGNRI